MTWRCQQTEIGNEVLKFSYVNRNDDRLSFREVVKLWADENQEGSLFRAFHCQILSDVGFNAYRWETPVVDSECCDRPFEYVTPLG